MLARSGVLKAARTGGYVVPLLRSGVRSPRLAVSAVRRSSAAQSFVMPSPVCSAMNVYTSASWSSRIDVGMPAPWPAEV